MCFFLSIDILDESGIQFSIQGKWEFKLIFSRKDVFQEGLQTSSQDGLYYIMHLTTEFWLGSQTVFQQLIIFPTPSGIDTGIPNTLWWPSIGTLIRERFHYLQRPYSRTQTKNIGEYWSVCSVLLQKLHFYTRMEN